MNEESIRQALVKSIAKIEINHSLGELNPLRAGGMADFFTIATTTIELATAVKAAIDIDLPYVIVGQGSAVLFSDGGFPGFVILNQARNCAFDRARSQVVVDSGVPLRECIARAAALGLGGMTSFYTSSGTVGGAAYANRAAGGFQFLSLVRSLTLLVPPGKARAEATITRHAGTWLKRDGEESTKLQAAKSIVPLGNSQQVILTEILQLTSMRPEEIRQAVAREAKREVRPPGTFGPIFHEVPGYDVNELLRSAGAANARVDYVHPHRYELNYIAGGAKQSRASDVWEVILAMRTAVERVHGIRLEMNIETLGVW